MCVFVSVLLIPKAQLQRAALPLPPSMLATSSPLGLAQKERQIRGFRVQGLGFRAFQLSLSLLRLRGFRFLRARALRVWDGSRAQKLLEPDSLLGSQISQTSFL